MRYILPFDVRLEIDWKIASTSSDIFFLRCIFRISTCFNQWSSLAGKIFRDAKTDWMWTDEHVCSFERRIIVDHRCKIQSVLETQRKIVKPNAKVNHFCRLIQRLLLRVRIKITDVWNDYYLIAQSNVWIVNTILHLEKELKLKDTYFNTIIIHSRYLREYLQFWNSKYTKLPIVSNKKLMSFQNK